MSRGLGSLLGPRHRAQPSHVEQATPRVPTGIPWGTCRSTGTPLDINLVAGQPTVIVAAGASEATVVAIIRALATGTTVAVTASRPGPWLALRQALGAHPEVFSVVPENANKTDLTPSPSTLVVHEVSAVVNEALLPREPWHTSWVTCPTLLACPPQILAIAATAMIGPEATDGAAPSLAAIGVRTETLQGLPALESPDVLVAQNGNARVVRIQRTATEDNLLGHSGAE